MRKQNILLAISLSISLFIYLFYRTERTVVNEVAIWLISMEAYAMWKTIVLQNIPLNDLIVYSLPEGLWIFCITLMSKPYYVSLRNWRLDCIYVPLIFCCSLEILQLTHLTNGRFDFADIGVFVLFWLLAHYNFTGRLEKLNMLSSFNTKTIVCLISYSIVYLSHVLNK